MQSGAHREGAGGVGRWVKLFPRVLFGSFSASTGYPDMRGFLPRAPKNVFQWCVWSLGVDLPRGQIFPLFIPQNIFQWAE